MKEFVIVQDNDCHKYIIPLEKFEDFNKWRDISSEDPTAWILPEYAVELDVGRVAFKNWHIV